MLPASVRNQFYHPSVCHTCKSAKDLKMCSKCKTLYYCSKEHQRQDWSNHKDLCNAISHTDAILPIYNQTTTTCIEDVISDGYRNKYFLQVLRMWMENLKRDLHPFELIIPMVRKFCLVCTIRNAPIRCNICSSVFYCSMEHQKMDDARHAASCASIKLNFQMLLFKYNTPFKHIPTLSKKYMNLEFSENLESLMKQLKEGSYISIPKNVSSHAYLLLTDSIAPIANILFGLEKANLLRNHMLENDELVVHIVGADHEEKRFDWCFLLEFAFHWIQNLNKLTCVLIGPKTGEWTMTPNSIESKMCGFCNMTPSNLKCFTSPKFYHEVVKELEKPDIIIGFNFSNILLSTWQLSIPSLTKQPSVPLVLTNIQLHLLEKTMQEIEDNAFREIEIILNPQRNPFSCLIPERLDFSDYPIYYKNGYIAIVNSKH